MKYKTQPKRMVVGNKLTGDPNVQAGTPECFHCGRLLVAKGKLVPNSCQGCSDKRKVKS